jgi:hypothetical protein
MSQALVRFRSFRRRYNIKTWHIENAVASVWLLTVAVVSIRTSSTGSLLELLGALAVWNTFCKNSIMTRMSEAEALRETPSTSCYPWAVRHLIAAEVCWTLYFIWHGAWAAVAGSVLMQGYQVWRKYYRKNLAAETEAA